MEVTRRSHALRTTPMLLAVTPLPNPLTTPPVTTTYFISLVTSGTQRNQRRSATARKRTSKLVAREEREALPRDSRSLPVASLLLCPVRGKEERKMERIGRWGEEGIK
ncbi:hypothetical protein GW17_00051594 [Ensete ventricosum]|nr:hypothetical protein GW17_00051594 [Ensete ventricosum]